MWVEVDKPLTGIEIEQLLAGAEIDEEIEEGLNRRKRTGEKKKQQYRRISSDKIGS